MPNKNRLAELADELTTNLNEEIIIEPFFNEIRVIVKYDVDKDNTYKEVSSLLNEIDKGKTKGVKIKFMLN